MNIKQKLAVFGTGIAGVGIGSLGLTAAFASPGSSPAVGPPQLPHPRLRWQQPLLPCRHLQR